MAHLAAIFERYGTMISMMTSRGTPRIIATKTAEASSPFVENKSIGLRVTLKVESI